MKNLMYILLLGLFVYSCGSTKDREMAQTNSANDTVQIGNDSLDFKLIVFEPGFETWLFAQPPKEAYNLGYLEQRNRFYVAEYNRRVINPRFARTNLYPHRINYDPDTDYGLKLNYMLFMYFEFFQEQYNQDLR